jgi:hypothetical protein
MKSPPPSPNGTANGSPSLRDVMPYLSAYEVSPTANDIDSLRGTTKRRGSTILQPVSVTTSDDVIRRNCERAAVERVSGVPVLLGMPVPTMARPVAQALLPVKLSSPIRERGNIGWLARSGALRFREGGREHESQSCALRQPAVAAGTYYLRTPRSQATPFSKWCTLALSRRT